MAQEYAISLEALRDAITQTLTALEERLGPKVLLTDDYYWHLPLAAAFDMTREPSDLTVGRLTDDLAHVRKPAAGEPEIAWHDLAHLGGLLRAVERAAVS